MIIKVNDYKIISLIGKGIFGTVYKVSKNNEYYAMKIFSLSLNNKKDLENVENETKILSKLNNEYCVHGHTPVMYMKEIVRFMNFEPVVDGEIYKYCGGHKINIDLGSFKTHRACLLNLDTFEPIYFKEN
jgi:serine/threonine protein kinase